MWANGCCGGASNSVEGLNACTPALCMCPMRLDVCWSSACWLLAEACVHASRQAQGRKISVAACCCFSLRLGCCSSGCLHDEEYAYSTVGVVADCFVLHAVAHVKLKLSRLEFVKGCLILLAPSCFTPHAIPICRATTAAQSNNRSAAQQCLMGPNKHWLGRPGSWARKRAPVAGSCRSQ